MRQFSGAKSGKFPQVQPRACPAMSAPLAIAPSGLDAARAKPGNLVFPVPPSPIIATGTDSTGVRDQHHDAQDWD
ncbi:hypothetical protein A8144_11105 [Mycobacterium leprae 3125609]|nr:hypothetical protein A8144_11105 [Mycobacterium leprae 3125609]